MTDPIASFLGDWTCTINFGSVLLRLLISVAFAAVIGCERATKRHAAGLRTFILVSMASTMATMVDMYFAEFYGGKFLLLSAATVIGTAIISSNSILYSSKNQIKGLTTSVGLWAVGVLGIAVGAGFYSAGLIGFVMLLFSLSLFPAFEIYLKNRSNHFEVHLELTNKAYLQDFVTTIRKLGLRVDDIESNPAYLNSGLSVYSVSVTICSAELKKYKTHSEIIEAIGTLDYVYYIEEMN